MITANYRGILMENMAYRPGGWPEWIYFRDWSGDYKRMGWGRGVEDSTLYGWPDAEFNAGPYDHSTESDFETSGRYFFNGSRNDIASGDLVYLNNVTIMVLGSGTTAPKKTDYKLESWIPTSRLRYETSKITGYTNRNENPVGPIDHIGELVYTYKNVSSDPITVGEIGIVKYVIDRLPTAPDNERNFNKILLARNVLDNPITIQPGELYTFTMVFK